MRSTIPSKPTRIKRFGSRSYVRVDHKPLLEASQSQGSPHSRLGVCTGLVGPVGPRGGAPGRGPGWGQSVVVAGLFPGANCSVRSACVPLTCDANLNLSGVRLVSAPPVLFPRSASLHPASLPSALSCRHHTAAAVPTCLCPPREEGANSLSVIFSLFTLKIYG